MKNNTRSLLKTSFLLFALIPGIELGHPTETPMELSINGKSLQIAINLPRDVGQVELRIESTRNEPITRFSAISPYDPDSVKRQQRYDETPFDTWYPAVDVRLERGMQAVCVFKGNPTGHFTFGGPYFNDTMNIQKEVVIPANRLEEWENSLRVDSKDIVPEKFYLRKTYPVLLNEFRHTFNLLSENWSGKVSVFAKTRDGLTLLAQKSVSPAKKEWWNKKLEAKKGQPLTRQWLLEALEATIHEGLRRQDTDPDSPTFGSFYTFYDLNANLYRTSYWLWGGAPYVKMTIDALKVPEIRAAFDSAALMNAMDRVGQLYLKYQVREKDHPSRGSFVTIWNRSPSGYSKWLGTSDSGIMHKWAMIPLYQATGNKAYLESTEFWCEQKGMLMKQHDMLPQFYLDDEGKFGNVILDETGWDPEGHAALYAVTKDEACKKTAKIFMDRRMDRFQLENGMWNRNWSISAKEANSPAYMTRGTGWAMEGLLAMNSMYPNTNYLDYARKMASQVMKYQNEDGSWFYKFDAPAGSALAVRSDKATPLWSLLFYRLYRATGEAQYLETAQKALKWCLENQYTGPDPDAIGGLVGRTNASMVGYRYYYDATCAYATGFFGLAILEQLKLMDNE